MRVCSLTMTCALRQDAEWFENKRGGKRGGRSGNGMPPPVNELNEDDQFEVPPVIRSMQSGVAQRHARHLQLACSLAYNSACISCYAKLSNHPSNENSEGFASWLMRCITTQPGSFVT